MPESPPRLFLTVRETADALRVDPATIYRAIRDGTFPAVRVRGRYIVPARAVDELVSRAVVSGSCVDASEAMTHHGADQPAREPRVAVPRPRLPGEPRGSDLAREP